MLMITIIKTVRKLGKSCYNDNDFSLTLIITKSARHCCRSTACAGLIISFFSYCNGNRTVFHLIVSMVFMSNEILTDKC